MLTILNLVFDYSHNFFIVILATFGAWLILKKTRTKKSTHPQKENVWVNRSTWVSFRCGNRLVVLSSVNCSSNTNITGSSARSQSFFLYAFHIIASSKKKEWSCLVELWLHNSQLGLMIKWTKGYMGDLSWNIQLFQKNFGSRFAQGKIFCKTI